MTPALTPGQLATLACIAEATAPKAGNVHPDAPFDDMTYADFVVSATVCEPILDSAATRGVGQTILDAVRATQEAVGVNTNLGLLLLLAPLCAGKLTGFTKQDARAVYDAVELARPGGVGKVKRPEVTLDEAMAMAAKRDLIARQYTNGFADVNQLAARLTELYQLMPLDQAVVMAHLELLASEPDSHLMRKGGDAKAAQRGAKDVLAGKRTFEDFDAWLREGRNPGTSADLIGAAVYVALRDGGVEYPWCWGEQA